MYYLKYLYNNSIQDCGGKGKGAFLAEKGLAWLLHDTC